MRRLLAGSVAALAGTVLVVAPTLSTAAASHPSPSGKVVLIMSQPLGDPFGDLVFSGLQILHRRYPKVAVKLLASTSPSAYSQQVIDSAKEGYNPVMVLWGSLGAVVVKEAPKFPRTKFIILDSYGTYVSNQALAKLHNVKIVAFDTRPASFIAGVVAAKYDETHYHDAPLGFIGDADIPVITAYLDGFEAGVHWVNPHLKIDVTYAGTFIDPAKGRQMALALYDQGIGIVMQAANKTGLGVLKAAQETGKQAVGVDFWQGGLAPGHVLWSATKDVQTQTYLAAYYALQGRMQPGRYVWNARQGAKLYFQRDYRTLSPQMKALVRKLAAELRSGKISIVGPRAVVGKPAS